MVAISLYKGNLHRVPDTPRRWLMPTPKISLKDFRCLLRRRSRALSRLQTPPTIASAPTTATAPTTAPTTATASDSNRNPDPSPNLNLETDSKSKPEEEVPVSVQVKSEEEEDVQPENVKVPEKLVDSSAVVVEPKHEVLENDQKLEVSVNPSGAEKGTQPSQGLK